MMIQSLKETFEAAERLSPEDQEALADRAEEHVRDGRVKDLKDWLNELPV